MGHRQALKCCSVQQPSHVRQQREAAPNMQRSCRAHFTIAQQSGTAALNSRAPAALNTCAGWAWHCCFKRRALGFCLDRRDVQICMHWLQRQPVRGPCLKEAASKHASPGGSRRCTRLGGWTGAAAAAPSRQAPPGRRQGSGYKGDTGMAQQIQQMDTIQAGGTQLKEQNWQEQPACKVASNNRHARARAWPSPTHPVAHSRSGPPACASISASRARTLLPKPPDSQAA